MYIFIKIQKIYFFIYIVYICIDCVNQELNRNEFLYYDKEIYVGSNLIPHKLKIIWVHIKKIITSLISKCENSTYIAFLANTC